MILPPSRGITLLLKSALIKVGNQRRAVMLLDDVHDLGIELVLEREVHALLHVSDDDQRAHRRSQFIMRVVTRAHVFGEVFRLHELADVMKIGADATQESGWRPPPPRLLRRGSRRPGNGDRCRALPGSGA